MPFLLLVDDSSSSTEAEKLLQQRGVKFLTVKPDGLSTKSSLPILLGRRKRYSGIDEIQKFAQEFVPSPENEKTRRTLRVFEELGIRANLSSFDERLRLQKIVYILEQFGLQMDWGFNWYIRGPYSPSLAHELFEHGDIDPGTLELSEGDRKAIEGFRTHFDPIHATPLELETAAAILYIRKASRDSYPGAIDLVARVLEQKPYLPEDLVKSYVRKLDKSFQS